MNSRIVASGIDIVDITVAIRAMLGTAAVPELPEHDYRFEVRHPSGATSTFGCHTTAADIIRYLNEGELE